MHKIINKTDAIFTPDSLNSKKSGFDTRVVIKANNTIKDGSQSIRVFHNKTVLPGRTKILEDVFPLAPNMEQHIFINDNVLGTTVDGQDSNPIQIANKPLEILPRNNAKLFARRKVKWWCAGSGAMNNTVLSQSYDSYSTNTKLYEMIPFRVIKANEQLPDEIRKQYKFEVVYPSSAGELYGYKGYYFKKIDFESLKGIHMEVDKIPYKPNWADTTVDFEIDYNGHENAFKGNKIQNNYIDMGMHINSSEFKEWFDLKGGMSQATISEIGLICGLDCKKISESNGQIIPIDDLDPEMEGYENIAKDSEVVDAELFSHLTFDPYPVSRENATIDFGYRIYS